LCQTRATAVLVVAIKLLREGGEEGLWGLKEDISPGTLHHTLATRQSDQKVCSISLFGDSFPSDPFFSTFPQGQLLSKTLHVLVVLMVEDRVVLLIDTGSAFPQYWYVDSLHPRWAEGCFKSHPFAIASISVLGDYYHHNEGWL